MQSFLGMAGVHRRHIKDFSKIARPLSELTKKENAYVWTDQCQEAFDILKEKLMTHPVLRIVEWDKPFFLTTDANKYALGGVLEQK